MIARGRTGLTADDDDEADAAGPPYAMTGGRTRSRPICLIETLVARTARARALARGRLREGHDRRALRRPRSPSPRSPPTSACPSVWPASSWAT